MSENSAFRADFKDIKIGQNLKTMHWTKNSLICEADKIQYEGN